MAAAVLSDARAKPIWLRLPLELNHATTCYQVKVTFTPSLIQLER